MHVDMKDFSEREELWKSTAILMTKPLLWSMRAALMSYVFASSSAVVFSLSGIVCFCVCLVFHRRLAVERRIVVLALLDATAALCFFLSLAEMPLLDAVVLHTLHLVFSQFSETLFASGSRMSAAVFGWAISMAGYFLSLTNIATHPAFAVAFHKQDHTAIATSLGSVLLTYARNGIRERSRRSCELNVLSVATFSFQADAIVGALFSYVRYIACRSFLNTCRERKPLARRFWAQEAFWLFAGISLLFRFVAAWAETRREAPKCHRVFDAYVVLLATLWTFLLPGATVNGAAVLGGCLMISGLATMSLRQETSSFSLDDEAVDGASDAVLLSTAAADMLESSSNV